MEPQLVHISTGGNRHPSAADWQGDLIAFGAGNNIALWKPGHGVFATLCGHTKAVNAVRLHGDLILSGSSDATVRIWQNEVEKVKVEHAGAVNTISVDGDRFVSGSADGTVKLWNLEGEPQQTITLKYIPLATALVTIADVTILAVAGTTSAIQIYAGSGDITLQATLTGHDGWIRSLDWQKTTEGAVLASTSQDKFIRLWQMTQGEAKNTTMEGLSNKIHRIRSDAHAWTIAYDALLIGHEDWVYSARWSLIDNTLLTASADNSLAIWRYSEIWICETRLGEISSLKGSTTATGSTGGFWNGLWSPDGQSVVSLSRTGSWRMWTNTTDGWQQRPAITGHTKEVQSVSWSDNYLLSTSSDQTTRLWAPYKDVWYEMARPQIHGYDLNCLASVNKDQFISGADEKLLRVFDKPRSTDVLLRTLAGEEVATDDLQGADLPVLGLSNKAIINDEADGAFKMIYNQPPLEDALARLTLWPEHEKLYGHGYEISAVAVNHARTLVATACKASTLDHAVVRLYETKTWREKAKLAAHTLTITSLAFSLEDTYLLSVGRDRQWALYKRTTNEEGDDVYATLRTEQSADTRMILACGWANDTVFATAGRGKSVKIWNPELVTKIETGTAITAMAFSDPQRLLYGTEDGELVLLTSDDDWKTTGSFTFHRSSSPSGAITSIAWRGDMAAVASADFSLRLYAIKGPPSGRR